MINIKDIRIALLCLFVVSIFFEGWEHPIFSSFLLTSKLQIAFILISLYDMMTSKTTKINLPFKCFLIWIFVFFLTNFFSYLFTSAVQLSVTLLGNVIYLFCAVDLFVKEERTIRYLAFVYLLSLIFIAYCTIIGVSYQVMADVDTGTERLYIFGMNPNGMSFMTVMAFSISLYLLLFYKLPKKVILWVLCFIAILSSGMLILITGSRGGLIMFFVAAIIITWTYSIKSKFSLLFLVLFGVMISFAFEYLWNTDMFQMRFSMDDKLAGRQELFKRGLMLFEESPIWGWGESGYEFRMKELFGESRPCHNGFIDIMALQGLLGLIPFLSFLIIAVCHYAKKLSSPIKYLVMAFWAVFVLNFLKDGGVLNAKYTWVLFSLFIYYTYYRTGSIRVNE